jgi:hypothetical protein
VWFCTGGRERPAYPSDLKEKTPLRGRFLLKNNPQMLTKSFSLGMGFAIMELERKIQHTFVCFWDWEM